MSGLSRFVRVHGKVSAVLAAGRACVALESTIITHGLPYPTNLHTALACEEAVRNAGAVPATVALLDGIAHVGLERGQLERLASVSAGQASHSSSNNVGHPPRAIKASRRDLATVLAAGQGTIGGTTVSGTMVLAHYAGIPIFATGGIGGVHRGAEKTMDISADLTELSRTPVAVFCSGTKSILSLPLTLEYLETAGVTVATFDQGGAWPAFYAKDSGLKATPVRDVDFAARIIHTSRELGLGNGIVFGVPIPESHAHAGDEIQRAVEQAVRESEEQGIDRRGKEVTPWLLARVGQLTSKALESNKALVINNARVAAETAVRYAELRQTHESGRAAGVPATGSLLPHGAMKSYPLLSSDAQTSTLSTPDIFILVVGCAAVDISARPSPRQERMSHGTTYPGCVSLAPGGVARNMAEAASRLLQANKQRFAKQSDTSHAEVLPLQLIAPVADDAFGKFLLAETASAGMRQDGFHIVSKMGVSKNGTDTIEHDGEVGHAEPSRSAVCSLILDADGDLQNGVADFAIASTAGSLSADRSSASEAPAARRSETRFGRHLHDSLHKLALSSQEATGICLLHKVVAFDANLGADVLFEIIRHKAERCGEAATSVPTLLYEPTSLPKCGTVLAAYARLLIRPETAGNVDTLVDVCTPNTLELLQLHETTSQLGLLSVDAHHNIEILPTSVPGLPSNVLAAARDLSALFGFIFLKRGEDGVTVFHRGGNVHGATTARSGATLRCSHHPVPSKLRSEQIVSTTGAGDTFAGALIAGIAMFGPPAGWSKESLSAIVAWAQLAASQTVRCPGAVAESLSNLVLTQ